MDTAQFLKDLRAERDRINNAIAALEALDATAISPAKTATKASKPAAVKGAKTPATAKKRVISSESRQRMAEAQQKRWAKKKRAVKAAAKKAAAVVPAETKPAQVARKKAAPKKAKVGITAAGRKKMSEAAKARWAAKKAAAKA